MNPNDIHLLAKLSGGNLCLSGGASGADALWGEEAAKLGHQVIHWSFEGHKSYGTPEQTVCLDVAVLKEAEIRLEEANLTLKRTVPYRKLWNLNLLRRNWFQVKDVFRVYAVGSLNEKAVISKDDESTPSFNLIGRSRVDRMGINGGTAWACQMFLDYYLERAGTDAYFDEDTQNRELELYFYDQITSEVYIYGPYMHAWYRARSSRHYGPPKGIYAAIGSRKLLPNGEDFIRSLMSASST